MKRVLIGSHVVGVGEPCYVIAEIGINHNGSVETAKQLIDAAHTAGCSAVKFQKRTPEVAVPIEQHGVSRETPWGVMPYIEYRRRLELTTDDFEEIGRQAAARGIEWFASCWDEPSVDFIEQFKPPCYKVASASLTDDRLLRHVRSTGRPVILSTGMSTIDQIDHAVDVLDTTDLVLLHTTSTYPARIDELNLRMIVTLRDRYDVPVGYSGHEVGLATTVAAVALGACIVERHITLDRSMWGTDQAASVEPQGFVRLVRDIRSVEMAMADGVKRVYESELEIRQKLRRVP